MPDICSPYVDTDAQFFTVYITYVTSYMVRSNGLQIIPILILRLATDVHI